MSAHRHMLVVRAAKAAQAVAAASRAFWEAEEAWLAELTKTERDPATLGEAEMKFRAADIVLAETSRNLDAATVALDRGHYE